jgi:hypothetical protein
MPTLNMMIANYTQRRMKIAIEPWGDSRDIGFGETFDIVIDRPEPDSIKWTYEQTGFAIHLQSGRVTVSQNGEVVLDYTRDGSQTSAPSNGDQP